MLLLFYKIQSQNNSLEGIITQIDTDEENMKVVVDIGKHDKIVSVMPLHFLDNMELIVGSSVFVSVKSNAIMLGI